MRAEELGDLQHRHVLVRHGVAGDRVRKSNLHGFILFQVGLKSRSELHSVSCTVRRYTSSSNATHSATVGRRKQSADLRAVTLQFQHASKTNQTCARQ